MQTPIVALIYDFDKTLCTTDMEDYTFIPALGYTPGEFWGRANDFGRENRMDGLLAYMYTMMQECRRQGIAQRLFDSYQAHTQGKRSLVWVLADNRPAVTMYEKNGFPAEKILYFMLRQKILTPGIRPYRSENIYKQLEEKEKLRREVRYLEEKAKGRTGKPQKKQL